MTYLLKLENSELCLAVLVHDTDLGQVDGCIANAVLNCAVEERGALLSGRLCGIVLDLFR